MMCDASWQLDLLRDRETETEFRLRRERGITECGRATLQQREVTRIECCCIDRCDEVTNECCDGQRRRCGRRRETETRWRECHETRSNAERCANQRDLRSRQHCVCENG